MPRLVQAARFEAGGVSIGVRTDDARAADALLGRWRAARRARGRPDLVYDLLLTPRRKRLIKDGRSHYAAGRVADVLHALELAVHVQLAHRTQAVPLHAGAARDPEGAVLLVGASGAGKSTLTRALVQRGWSYLADEHVFVGGDLRARGLPRAIGDWTPTRADVSAEAPVARLVFLETPRRVGGALEPVPRGEAAALLSAALMRAPREGDLQVLSRLAGQVPAWRLACEGVAEAVQQVTTPA